jgi:hypothetical protein
MPKWFSCTGSFTDGDVYQWREPVWKPRARKTSKPVRIGERHITAQLDRHDGDWLFFTLMDCKTKNAETWWKNIPELKKGETLRRSRRALMKKNPERRAWGTEDGESARAITSSKYLR